MYPPGSLTAVEVTTVTDTLEGAVRPGHFRGVATVVAKLFTIVQPTRAYFGHQGAQQSILIRRMVRDLDMPLDVIVCPPVREADRLAMRRRSGYLQRAEEHTSE